jgi:hypothetical protein
MTTKEQADELTRKYFEKDFVFRNVYNDAPGWKHGDKGKLIRLYHPDSDRVRNGVYDLWLAKNITTNEICDVWTIEIVDDDGKPIIEEQTSKNDGLLRITHIDIRCSKCNLIAVDMSRIESKGICRDHGDFSFTFENDRWYRYGGGIYKLTKNGWTEKE